MKLAIMQPYLFPYLGYFQMLAAVDKFVFYDDVNFIKNGWINRNRLILGGSVRYITVPLSGASPFQKINEVLIQDRASWQRKLVESLRHSYGKAPHFEAVSDLVNRVLFSDETKLGEIAKQSVVSVAQYLDLPTEFVPTSACYKNDELHGVDRVIDICRQEDAQQYVNLPGGRALYEPALFKVAGVDLRFVKPRLDPYPQSCGGFEPGLSIIDMLMFNEPARARAMLSTEVVE